MAVDHFQFARLADGRDIAYRVISDADGPLILHCAGAALPADLLDEDPMYDRFLRTLGLAGRLVVYDRLGNGSSDPIDPDRGYFEQMTATCIAVIDAEHAEAAWIVGSTLAAMTETIRTHRDRIAGAVLLNPISMHGWRQSIDDGIERRRRTAAEMVESFSPSRAGDEAFVEWLRRAQRLGASASQKATFAAMNREAVRRFAEDAEPVGHEHRVLMIQRRAAGSDAQSAWWRRIHPGVDVVTVEGSDWNLPTSLDAGYIAELAAGFITGAAVETPSERPLRAVLFCDLVDSTSTAAARGDAAWRATLDRYEAVLARTAEGRHGTVVKHTGDGALITFASGSAALAAAVELRNRTRELALEGRIGVHLGEVEQRGDDIGGIAVNLAARVMGEAGPGEIVVTSSVEETTVGGRFRFDDLGTRSLKGIDRPWRLFVAEP